MESRAEPAEVPQPTQAQADEFKERAHGDEEEAATAPPSNVDVPYVSGNGTMGATLNCTMGNWNGTPTSYAYQWKSNGTANLGTGDSYVVAAGDAGHSITCVVTASNAAGSTAAPPSNAVVVAEAETQPRRK
jgi:hypothetical protein